MSSLAPFFVIAIWASNVHARNETFIHGWRPEPDGRGTWSILWSCLATIFICTWSALHLDLPEHHGRWYLFLRKSKYMLLAFMAPEYILALSADRYFDARDVLRKLNERGYCEWTFTHMLFAYGRGFCTRTPEGGMEPCRIHKLAMLIEKKIVNGPPVSEVELQARGKSDPVVKLIAVLQIVWFVVETLFRAIQHYQTTALEIMTVAFVFCTVFTYGLCWYVPQDVEYPVIVEKRAVTPVTEGAAPDQSRDSSSRTDQDAGSLTYGEELVRSIWSRANMLLIILSLFACGFGAFHCLAWNSPFPTSKERLAWRICSVATTVMPCYLPLFLLKLYFSRRQVGLSDYITVPLAILYALARTTIIVLAFMTLRALPADAFQTVNWNNYFPHFAA